MIRSMTGFGSADGMVGSAHVAVEVRSVNHRFFSPSIKLPASLARWEGDVRDTLRRSVSRGHVTLTARIDRAEAQPAAIDESRLRAYAEQLRGVKERLGLAGDVELATLLRLPDVISIDRDEEEGTAAELVAIVERASALLQKSRESEGGRLAAFIAERIALVEGAVDRLGLRAPKRLEEQRDRLRAAVQELAQGVKIDDQRMAQEIAILADRLDVGEELDRFKSHIVAFRETLASRGEAVGKRLGFLLQELLREANTTGAKSNDAEMVREVVMIKEELERIREQVENLE